jgi:hypothetical protein
VCASNLFKSRPGPANHVRRGVTGVSHPFPSQESGHLLLHLPLLWVNLIPVSHPVQTPALS